MYVIVYLHCTCVCKYPLECVAFLSLMSICISKKDTINVLLLYFNGNHFIDFSFPFAIFTNYPFFICFILIHQWFPTLHPFSLSLNRIRFVQHVILKAAHMDRRTDGRADRFIHVFIPSSFGTLCLLSSQPVCQSFACRSHHRIEYQSTLLIFQNNLPTLKIIFFISNDLLFSIDFSC